MYIQKLNRCQGRIFWTRKCGSTPISEILISEIEHTESVSAEQVFFWCLLRFSVACFCCLDADV